MRLGFSQAGAKNNIAGELYEMEKLVYVKPPRFSGLSKRAHIEIMSRYGFRLFNKSEEVIYHHNTRHFVTFLTFVKTKLMPEIIVKYKNKRTLDALKDFAKYFDYIISSPVSRAKKKKQFSLNGVTIIPADNSVDTSDLTEIFTGKNINSSELRNNAWQRIK